MLVSDILSTVRPWINDTAATYRWSDTELLAFANLGQTELFGRHPELFSLTALPSAKPADYTAVGDTITAHDSTRAAWAHYIAWAAYMEDTDDTGNAALATAHWDNMLRALGDVQ